MGILVTPEEVKLNAVKFLQSEHNMVLGTSLKDEVWSATVEFVATDEFELIFYSRPDSRHSQNIADNPNVSAVITQLPPKKTGNLSIQMSGLARAADGAEWNHYYPIYEKKVKTAGKQPDHIIYVIKPEEIWMIDEKLLGHRNRVEVDLRSAA